MQSPTMKPIEAMATTGIANARNGGLHDETKQIVKHDAAGHAGEQIPCGGQRSMLRGIDTRLAP